MNVWSDEMTSVMSYTRLILVGLSIVAIVVLAKVWSEKENYKGSVSELFFEDWPNKTRIVMNETVKFLRKCHVKGTEVDIRWDTLNFLPPNASTKAAEREHKHLIKNFCPSLRQKYKSRMKVGRQRQGFIGRKRLYFWNSLATFRLIK